MRITFGGLQEGQRPNGLVDWEARGDIAHEQKREKALSYVLTVSSVRVGMDEGGDFEKFVRKVRVSWAL